MNTSSGVVPDFRSAINLDARVYVTLNILWKKYNSTPAAVDPKVSHEWDVTSWWTRKLIALFLSGKAAVADEVPFVLCTRVQQWRHHSARLQVRQMMVNFKVSWLVLCSVVFYPSIPFHSIDGISLLRMLLRGSDPKHLFSLGNTTYITQELIWHLIDQLELICTRRNVTNVSEELYRFLCSTHGRLLLCGIEVLTRQVKTFFLSSDVLLRIRISSNARLFSQRTSTWFLVSQRSSWARYQSWWRYPKVVFLTNKPFRRTPSCWWLYTHLSIYTEYFKIQLDASLNMIGGSRSIFYPVGWYFSIPNSPEPFSFLQTTREASTAVKAPPVLTPSMPSLVRSSPLFFVYVNRPT